MAPRTEFKWDRNDIGPNLRDARAKGRAYLSRTTTYHALRAEAYAKVEAKWKDRTGNARQGLAAVGDNSMASQDHWEIVIFHKVTYGIWLEVRFGGKYAIIRPTMLHEAPEYWDTAREVLSHMFGKATG